VSTQRTVSSYARSQVSNIHKHMSISIHAGTPQSAQQDRSNVQKSTAITQRQQRCFR
jgi:hypothetical protein